MKTRYQEISDELIAIDLDDLVKQYNDHDVDFTFAMHHPPS